MDQSLLLASLSKFARALPTAYDIQAVLPDLTDSVASVLGVSGSGVTLAENGRLEFAIASEAPFDELEQVQVRCQAGPCHDAFDSGEVVAVSDLGQAADRWEGYVPAALRAGVHGVVGIPMTVGDQPIGALNLYSYEPRDWSEEELAVARVLADVGTSYLVNASKVRQLEQLTEQLQHALNARVVVEQAKGVIARHNDIGMDEAYHRIRQHARSHKATVRAVAEAVVTVGLRI